MYTPELLRQLCAHMEWADAKLWSEVLKADEAHDDERLRDKLLHLHETQQAFLSLWTGQSPARPEQAGSLVAVYEGARRFYAPARRFLEATDARALAEPVSDAFGDRMRQRFGPPSGAVTLGVTVYQVVAHTTHHRGQVMTRLRELGGTPPLVSVGGLRDLGVVGHPRRGMGAAATVGRPDGRASSWRGAGCCRSLECRTRRAARPTRTAPVAPAARMPRRSGR